MTEHECHMLFGCSVARHAENVAFFTCRAEQEMAERNAARCRHQAQHLRDFGCYDVGAIPSGGADEAGACVRCRKERRLQRVMGRNSAGFFIPGVLRLSSCGCCRECAGRGYRWERTPLPKGVSEWDYDWVPPADWRQYTKRPCKACQRPPGRDRLPGEQPGGG